MTKALNHSNPIVRLLIQTLTLVFVHILVWLPLAKAGDEPGGDATNGEKRENSIRLGWEVFHSKCFGCHGTGAEGSIVAPSLVQSIDKLSLERFSDKVLKGHVLVLGYTDATGDDRTAVRQGFIELLKKRENSGLIMPAWEDDPVVNEHIGDLFHYLKARAEGSLGPGLPGYNIE